MLGSSVLRPVKELKSFKKVFLDPGQSEIVKFKIDKNDLSFWDSQTKLW